MRLRLTKRLIVQLFQKIRLGLLRRAYRALFQISLDYSRLQGRFLCYPNPFAMAASRFARYGLKLKFKNQKSKLQCLAKRDSIIFHFEIYILHLGSITQSVMRPYDLHALSTPPAFILSQDQTLNKDAYWFTVAITSRYTTKFYRDPGRIPARRSS